MEDINRLLEKLNIDTKNGVLFYEVKVRGRVSGLEPPRAEYELKENIVLNGLMTDFICGNPNSKKFLHIKIIPVWSAWKNKPLMYELTIIYRENKEKLVEFLGNLDAFVKLFLEKIKHE